MVRSVSLIVLCIFAKRFVLSVSGFLSQRNFCTTAVLLWGTHWGAVSWIVLFFSCRAIPRARSGPVWGSDIDYSTHICLCAQRLSACLKRGLRILQGRFSRVLLAAVLGVPLLKTARRLPLPLSRSLSCYTTLSAPPTPDYVSAIPSLVYCNNRKPETSPK